MRLCAGKLSQTGRRGAMPIAAGQTRKRTGRPYAGQSLAA
jgi:hypothetical protein